MSHPQTSAAKTLLLTIIGLALMAGSLKAIEPAPPSPKLIEKMKESGEVQRLFDRLQAGRAHGAWSRDLPYVKRKGADAMSLGDTRAPDTMHTLVLLIDFSDNPAAGGDIYAQVSDFEHLLFSFDDYDGFYSMAEFYRDNSYGEFILTGDVYGWYRMPQTYAYYVDGQNGWGECPQCVETMVIDAVTAADPDVDYTLYDNDGDGFVDGPFIVHAGSSAEWAGSDDMIWSHVGGIWGTELDGVEINVYSTEPEEQTAEIQNGLSTIGVYCHEFGHVLGLPDLYDYDKSSAGVGDWSLMSYGSWNRDGRYPSFYDAWCKKELGFLTPTTLTQNMANVDIPTSYYDPLAYRSWPLGGGSQQYFLVENRRMGEYDQGLPGEGLLIMHIDEAQWGNDDETRPLVAIEQADGKFQLETYDNTGDVQDVWTAYTHDTFDDRSVPDSRDYDDDQTQVAVWNISPADSVMTANLDIEWSHPKLLMWGSDSIAFDDSPPGGDGDGHLEAGETVDFYCTVVNVMRTGYFGTLHLSTGNPDVAFTVNDVMLAVFVDGSTSFTNTDPIQFTLSDPLTPIIDSFFLTITCDSVMGTPGSEHYVSEFVFDVNVGPPQVLIVDDDRGENYERFYVDHFYEKRTPYVLLEVAVEGTPSAGDLGQSPRVFWFTGDEGTDLLGADDVAAMQSYLAGGGNMLLSSLSGAADLADLDSAFLHDYFGAVHAGSSFSPMFDGVPGNPIGDGLKFRYQVTAPYADQELLEPAGSGQAAFELAYSSDVCGVTFDGSHRAVLLSMPIEYLSDEFVANGFATRGTLIDLAMNFLGGEFGDCCRLRGDIDHDGSTVIDIADLTYLVEYMYLNGPAPPCHEEGDVNADGEPTLDISDLVYLVDYMFQAGPEPAPCTQR